LSVQTQAGVTSRADKSLDRYPTSLPPLFFMHKKPEIAINFPPSLFVCAHKRRIEEIFKIDADDA
jgi:hypothetical protein